MVRRLLLTLAAAPLLLAATSQPSTLTVSPGHGNPGVSFTASMQEGTWCSYYPGGPVAFYFDNVLVAQGHPNTVGSCTVTVTITPPHSATYGAHRVSAVLEGNAQTTATATYDIGTPPPSPSPSPTPSAAPATPAAEGGAASPQPPLTGYQPSTPTPVGALNDPRAGAPMNVNPVVAALLIGGVIVLVGGAIGLRHYLER